MAALMIACPITGQSFSTGIEISEEQIGRLPNVLSAAHCPHCGAAHEWNVKDAWLVDESGNRLGSSA